ncbi:MAG: alpha/beta fold hydrolase, partial [Bacteroidota bacterium]
MTTDIFTLTATDGHALYAKHWLPDDAPKAILVIIHGFYEHLGRYEHVAQGFIDQGYGAYAIDQRGHGQTKGKRGHGVLSQVLNDIETLLMHVRAEHTTIPIILYGHSWGGCNVSHFLLRKTTNELSGAILSSPWLRLALIPPKGKERLGNIMAKIWPSLTVANQLAPGSLSRDPAVEKAYLDDPLVHIKISAGIFKEITDVGPWIIDH